MISETISVLWDHQNSNRSHINPQYQQSQWKNNHNRNLIPKGIRFSFYKVKGAWLKRKLRMIIIDWEIKGAGLIST